MEESVQKPYAGFAARLKEIRERVGKTQDEFASYVDTSSKSIYRYEAGEQLPSGREMLKLALAFPGEIEWILTGRDLTEDQKWQVLRARLSVEEYAYAKLYAQVLASHDRDFIGLIEPITALVKELAARVERIGTTMEIHSP